MACMWILFTEECCAFLDVQVVKAKPTSLAQVGFVVGLLVELLHLDHGSNPIGKGSVGLHSGSPGEIGAHIPEGAQMVTITKAF